MTTLSEMPPAEQAKADESPALRAFGEAWGYSRFMRWMAIYILRDELQGQPRTVQTEILNRFATKVRTSSSALRADLPWSRKIEEKDLRSAFQREKIPDSEWSERIGVTHLRAAARAQHPDGRPMTSPERCKLLVDAFHAGMSAVELEEDLRRQGRLEAKRLRQPGRPDGDVEAEKVLEAQRAVRLVAACLAGEYGPYVQAAVARSWAHREENLPDRVEPTTACTLVPLVMDALRRSERDVDLRALLARQGHRPLRVARLFRRLADKYEAEHPGARVNLSQETVARPSETSTTPIDKEDCA